MVLPAVRFEVHTFRFGCGWRITKLGHNSADERSLASFVETCQDFSGLPYVVLEVRQGELDALVLMAIERIAAAEPIRLAQL